MANGGSYEGKFMKAVQSRRKLLAFGVPLLFACATVITVVASLTRRPTAAIPSRNTPEAFVLSSPLCPPGFALAQRFDTRDRFGIIVKREWKMTGCAKGRIVYGRKV